MPASRYAKRPFIQPVRIIPSAPTDIIYTFQQADTIDILAYKFYKDATLGWVIMCANPDEYMEFFVKPGTQLRIPFPLTRVWEVWGESSEM